MGARDPGDPRERIKEAAVELFARNGFHGTGVRELARAAGVKATKDSR